jgi:hypothetical protein
MRFLAVMAILLGLAACSPVQRIAKANNAIRLEARNLSRHGEATGDRVVIDSANRIDELAAGVAVDLSQVEDKTPAWMTMLQWWGIALAAVALLVILWQSGALTGLRILVGWLPRKKVAQAELAVDMLDPSRPEGDREYVAAMRAQDPEFDAAFRKAQKRRKA